MGDLLPEGLTAYDLETLQAFRGGGPGLPSEDRCNSVDRLTELGLIQFKCLIVVWYELTALGRLVLALAERCQKAEAERDKAIAVMVSHLGNDQWCVRRVEGWESIHATRDEALAAWREYWGLEPAEATDATG